MRMPNSKEDVRAFIRKNYAKIARGAGASCCGGGCIGGAEHIDRLEAMLRRAGFQDIRMTPKDNSREIVSSWAPGSNVEDFVASFVIEAVKG
jgi:hypothetical protein